MYLKTTRFTLGLAVISLSFQLHAATLVKNKDAMGGINAILIDKDQARMESKKSGQYMLMYFKDKKAYAVNDNKKQIIDMASPMPQGANPKKSTTPAPTIQAKLVKVDGDSPKIAGYDTVHYQVFAGDTLCSDEYLAPKALEVANIKAFMQGMQAFAKDRREQMGDMARQMMQRKPCMAAKEDLTDEFNRLGLSMRSVKEGKVQHEIVEISTDALTDAKTFALPEGYTTTSPFEMMQKALSNMSSHQASQGAPAVNAKPPADLEAQINDIIKKREAAQQQQ